MRRLVALVAGLAASTSAADAAPACHRARSAIETMIRVDAHTLRLCWQSPDTCFALDVDAKAPAWAPVAKPKPGTGNVRSSTIPGVTVGMTVDVCATDGKDCRPFVVPPDPVSTLSMTYALANADRSLIAVVTYRGIALFDGKGARRGTITSWKPDVGIGWSVDDISFYGDRVFVQLGAGHDAETRVFDTAGTQVATIGDGGVARVGALALPDGTLAFATSFGEKLDLRDRTGKRVHLVDAFGSTASPELSDRAEQLALRPDGRIAVARGDGSVALVDVARGTVAMLPPPPACR